MNNERPSKHQYYIGIAAAVSARSTCLRRHYGCVIVKNDEIIATGYNGNPRGMVDCVTTGVCTKEVPQQQPRLVRAVQGSPRGDERAAVCSKVGTDRFGLVPVLLGLREARRSQRRLPVPDLPPSDPECRSQVCEQQGSQVHG